MHMMQKIHARYSQINACSLKGCKIKGIKRRLLKLKVKIMILFDLTISKCEFFMVIMYYIPFVPFSNLICGVLLHVMTL